MILKSNKLNFKISELTYQIYKIYLTQFNWQYVHMVHRLIMNIFIYLFENRFTKITKIIS